MMKFLDPEIWNEMELQKYSSECSKNIFDLQNISIKKLSKIKTLGNLLKLEVSSVN